MVARVAVGAASYAIDKLYEYRIPEEWVNEVQPGHRVWVPFGRGNSRKEGIVLSVSEAPQGSPVALKLLSGLMDQEPLYNETMLKLAAFMRERYFCTFFEAARVMLPAGLWYKSEVKFSLTPGLS